MDNLSRNEVVPKIMGGAVVMTRFVFFIVGGELEHKLIIQVVLATTVVIFNKFDESHFSTAIVRESLDNVRICFLHCRGMFVS